MIERALRFGESTTMVGVLTQPDPGAARANAPAVLILNSGIIHHIGANRIYVRLARSLAEAGFTCLRFDFSGVGDSEARRDDLAFEESAVLETREAMDYLGGVSGASEFLLAGLCSGADMAYYTSLADPRVVGLAQLDAFVYRTPKWYLKRFGPKLLSPAAWSNALRVRLAERFGSEEDKSAVFVAPEYRRVFPPKSEIESGMHRLADRGLRFFFTFTGDEEEILYREQYVDTFSSVDFGDRIRVEYMPESDHTFSNIENQHRVVRMLTDWAAGAWREDGGQAGADSVATMPRAG